MVGVAGFEGVTYELTAGELEPGKDVTVTATLAEGYALAAGAKTKFENEFDLAVDCTGKVLRRLGSRRSH